jgi:hypothetical protein
MLRRWTVLNQDTLLEATLSCTKGETLLVAVLLHVGAFARLLLP